MTSYHFPNEFQQSHVTLGSTTRYSGLEKFTLSTARWQHGSSEDRHNTTSKGGVPNRSRPPIGPVHWLPRNFTPILETRKQSTNPDTPGRPVQETYTVCSAARKQNKNALNGYAGYTKMWPVICNVRVDTPPLHGHLDPTTLYRNIPVVTSDCGCSPCPIHGLHCEHIKGVLPVRENPADPDRTPEKFVDMKHTAVVLRSYGHDVQFSKTKAKEKPCSSRHSSLFIAMCVIITMVILGIVIGIIIWSTL